MSVTEVRQTFLSVITQSMNSINIQSVKSTNSWRTNSEIVRSSTCPAESFWQRSQAVLSWLKHFVGVFSRVPRRNFSHPINKRRRAETLTALLLLKGADYSQGLQDRTLPVLLGRLVKMERIWKLHQGQISTAWSHRFKKPNQRAHPMRAFISFLMEISPCKSSGFLRSQILQRRPWAAVASSLHFATTKQERLWNKLL